jgi:hypothetical protein
MRTDYNQLYGDGYFGHANGAVSFQQALPAALVQIAREHGCYGILDVGTGNGELLASMRDTGLRLRGIDYRADEDRGIWGFDLSLSKSNNNTETINRIRGDLGDTRHLATCFDVLEHIDRGDLPAALWNLNQLADELLVVSVSTRPSSGYNQFHPSVLPRSIWTRLFNAMGFVEEPDERVNQLARVVDYPEEDGTWCIRHWQALDPFRDGSGGEPYYMFLRRAHAVNRTEFYNVLSGFPLTDNGVSSVSLPADLYIFFLVGHYQDFLQMRPLWEKLPAGTFRVLLRTGALSSLDQHRDASIQAWLSSRGILCECVSGETNSNWSSPGFDQRVLVCASESSVWIGHVLNSAILVDARHHGVTCFQLQHGIWPHASFSEPVVFQADHVLSWSKEFEAGFNAEFRDPVTGEQIRKGVMASSFIITGCPRFDGYASDVSLNLADLLGDWVSEYRASVLMATNLHWDQHRNAENLLARLIQVAEEMPDVLFVCRPHPVHDVDWGSFTLPDNVVVVDVFVSLFSDVDTTHLVKACDAVVCTLSTVALEAALAQRPFAVIDTSNANSYVGVDTVSADDLVQTVRQLLSSGCVDHSEFADYYYDQSTLGTASDSVIRQIGDAGSGIATSASREALMQTVNAFAQNILALQYQLGEALAGIDSLPRANAELTRELAAQCELTARNEERVKALEKHLMERLRKRAVRLLRRLPTADRIARRMVGVR